MQPEFTLISPMHNVARFLPDFFASLERQTYGFHRVQVILVDDGSDDETASFADAFADRHANVTVIRKENGGQASARNAALPHAIGTWLTFPDPDDMLADDYLAIVAAAINHDHPQALLSTRLLLWFDANDEIKDTHALAGRFRQGAVSKNLNTSPSWIQPHVTTGFVQRSVVEKAGLAFPEDLRLRFEDGAFIARYLLAVDEPTVMFIPDAHYRYRQRSDNTSTIQSSNTNPAKYTDTIRLGFLRLIDEVLQTRPSLPRWLQNLFLYDQFWILRASQSPAVRDARFPEEMYAELDELLPALLQHIDEERIANFDVMPVAPWMRDALILRKRGGGLSPVYWGERDPRTGLRAIIFRGAGEWPEITLSVDGAPAEPRYTKDIGLEYVGRPIATQRTLWVPDPADIILRVDGEVKAISNAPPVVQSAFRIPGPKAGPLRTGATRVRKALARRLGRRGVTLVGRDLALRSTSLASKFKDAWVFIDRDTDAGDSAEDQYWWTMRNHPEVNSWFVVRKGTRDWARMKEQGARLVGYGTPEFYVLLREAQQLASSHADRFVTDALPRALRPPKYAFTFLQHGVIKGDISRWLNAKNIQVFVASTRAEYDYITGPDRFRFGAKEVQLTGLPRFDALAERAAEVQPDEKNLILIMPTWRDYLIGPMGSTSQDRPKVEHASRPYLDAIGGLLNDPALLDAAKAAGHRIVFMPHPNMRPYLDSFDLPPEVEIASYADTDVRELLIRAVALVTDYSSIAFNAAFLMTPVVYFQFDRDEYFAGHTEGPGYFEYERDGFGPVAPTLEMAVDEIIHVLAEGADEQYMSRARECFPYRDGRNRERVYQAMLEAVTVRPLAERSRAAEALPESTQKQQVL